MLVISRKVGESIIIDERIKVTVGQIRGDKVRLCCDAPKTVSVHRQEVFEAIQREGGDLLASAKWEGMKAKLAAEGAVPPSE